ncbi:tRNA pseudouridine(38-40) synthase TruA [Actinomarinicola tropica]|uniref:tRNA pseudouridine synthase A n=1 Tax=Actinomarinicola tropica TaxID=2789776 RepID=A0A5Q2RGF6_9ACTN|nr:tRNA pseudouridine(38-40) synthase TruA [Actinomarinicola tropica]QGG93892.1 tRNA pseudouridine(38-40) synthase TruA [Actinomarinicola tropica]
MPDPGYESPTLFDLSTPDEPETSGPVARVRMVVAYDGAPFHGFAPNAGVRTVGGDLAAALGRLLGRTVELTVAGRTDKGVHAHGNVVSFDAPAEGLDPQALRDALNKMLQPHVAVRHAAVAPDGFDARFSATARTYRYTVLNRDVPDPLLADRSWFVDAPLDLAAMRLACDPLIGEHDFTSFCRKPKRTDGADPVMVRRVRSARWDDLGDGLLRFEIRANAFCHQMVRSIVGLLVEVGLGRRHAGDVLGVIRARDRHAAGRLAPPQGLVLWHVELGEGSAD